MAAPRDVVRLFRPRLDTLREHGPGVWVEGHAFSYYMATPTNVSVFPRVDGQVIDFVRRA